MKYEHEINSLRRSMRFEFQKNPPGATLSDRSHTEMRGRKARHSITASHQPEDRDDH